MNLVILPLMVAAAHAAAPVALEAAAAPVAVAEEAGDHRNGKRESYHTMPQSVPR